jgi:hypothetical protein
VRQRLLIAFVTAFAAACTGNARTAEAAAEAASGDTVRGRVSITGPAPAQHIVLVTAAGPVSLAGERQVLEQLSGVEVTLWGRADAGGLFHVGRVAVRAAEGIPAVDGVLRREGGQFLLQLADGSRLQLRHVPPELQPLVGTRVWFAGPLDRPPELYGVIRAPAPERQEASRKPSPPPPFASDRTDNHPQTCIAGARMSIVRSSLFWPRAP